MERFISNQLIVDSGKDDQGRPILAVYCCHFPDPEGTDYDVLFQLSLKRLNRIVANEYILVVFSEPMDYGPSISWMYRAYKTLSRDYKKNIKQLIIVHPTWWFRLIIGFMQNIVSSKFAKKIVNVDSIEELEDLISTADMMIPTDILSYDREENGEETYNEKEMENAKAVMDTGKKQKIFKVSLSEYDGEDEYPVEIKDLMEYLTNKGLKNDGIFRRAPNQESLSIIIAKIDEREPIAFEDYDVYTIASVLKEYVRGLPETLIPLKSYDILQTNTSLTIMSTEELIPFIQSNFLKPLDNRSIKLLKDLMMLSAMTSQLSNLNRMSTKAMAVVWAPNMIRLDSKAEELKIITAVIKVIECMIENYDQVFCRKY